MPAERSPVRILPLPSAEAEESGTLVSLYSGAGGLDLGFAAAGFRPVWANDIDPLAVATYNKVFDGDHATSGDIAEGAKLRDDVPREGAADLVIGGPPCQ